MKQRQWFEIKAKAGDETAELFIYGNIGESWWDDSAVSAKDFIDELRALPESVTKVDLHVNSLGGSCADAAAIANALRAWGAAKTGRTVTSFVDGVAASAASVVIMAGSVIKIADNAVVMIHNPWTWVVGNAAEMRKMADALDKIRDSIVASYKWHSELSDDELVALMDAETWMSADEAIENGFATEKVEGLKAAASLSRDGVLGKLNVPEKFKALVDALVVPPANSERPTAAPAADVLRLCREGEVLDLAEGLIGAGATLADVEARIASERQTRAAAKERATQITSICSLAKCPELAAGLIASAMTIDAVKAHVTVITAKLDRVEIESNIAPASTKEVTDKGWKTAFARVNAHKVH